MRAAFVALAVSGLLLSGVAACSDAAPPASEPGASVDPAAARHAGASRQSAAEADATLASLRRVPGTHLYEMTYTGAYDPLTGIATPSAAPFGCSLFFASGNPAAPVFARNFDWDANPALVLHTAPPDAHASVSVVDISYLGVPAGVDPLTDASARRELLDAPLLPFDGMNAKGLVVGMAADETGRADRAPGLPTVGSVRVMRLMLDRAATVEEALALLDRYNIDFDDGPPLHYLLADATGASAVVEYVDGRRVVIHGGPPWQALTNFRLSGADAATKRGDRRYSTAQATLDARAGALDWRQSLDVLRAVAQPHTQWSVTYEPRTGAMHLVARQNWTAVHEFTVPGFTVPGSTVPN